MAIGYYIGLLPFARVICQPYEREERMLSIMFLAPILVAAVIAFILFIGKILEYKKDEHISLKTLPLVFGIAIIIGITATSLSCLYFSEQEIYAFYLFYSIGGVGFVIVSGISIIVHLFCKNYEGDLASAIKLGCWLTIGTYIPLMLYFYFKYGLFYQYFGISLSY